MSDTNQLILQLRQEIDLMQSLIQDKVEQADRTPTLLATAQQQGFKALDLKMAHRRLLRGHFGKIYAMQWCPAAGHFIASASQDSKLIIWNALSQNKINAIPLRSSWIMSTAYSVSGSHVACGGLENICYVYRLRDATNAATDAAKFPPYAELGGHDGYISSCRFLSDNEILTASGDSTCILWDITRAPLQKFSGHYGDVMSVALHGNNTFVSGSVDASVKLWDIRQSGTTHVKTFRGHDSDVNSVSFFPDGNAVVTGSDDSSCRMFDVRACGQVAKFVTEPACGVTSVSFSNSGRLLFAGYDDCNCVVWDSALNTKLSTLQHDNRVSCLGVSCDGKALATGSWDQQIKVWL